MQLCAADSSGADETAQAPVPQPHELAIFCRSGGSRELLLPPLRRQGEGPGQKLAASAAPTNGNSWGLLPPIAQEPRHRHARLQRRELGAAVDEPAHHRDLATGPVGGGATARVAAGATTARGDG